MAMLLYSHNLHFTLSVFSFIFVQPKDGGVSWSGGHGRRWPNHKCMVVMWCLLDFYSIVNIGNFTTRYTEI